MRVAICAYEGIYQGLHGMQTWGVVDVEDLQEANEYGLAWSYNLIEDYGLEDEYEELNFAPDPEWYVYKVREDVPLDTFTLDAIAAEEGFFSFVEEYCEPEEWH